MTKKENLLAAIKKEIIRQIREGEMEFNQNGITYIVPKEHITLLLSTQSLEVLNLSYPKDSDAKVLENDCLEECTETSFDGEVNIPNMGYRKFNGSAKVSYKDREFGIRIIMPVRLNNK